MPTSPINAAQAASSIAALVRKALSTQVDKRRAAEVDKKSESKRKAATSPNGKQPANPQADLSLVVARRIQELHPDAPDYKARVLRLLVEAALVQEFGEHLINAPRFQGVIDLVAREITSAPQMQQDIDTVLSSLAQAGGSASGVSTKPGL